jgi:hypothetical protein
VANSKIDIPVDFAPASKGSANKQSLASFSTKMAHGRGSSWHARPDAGGATRLLEKRIGEYSKGFHWGPTIHTEWLRKEIVDIDGRPWADWRFVPMAKGAKDYARSPVYTRFLSTSYKGQLLEITFTTNLNTEPELKEKIDRIMESIRLTNESRGRDQSLRFLNPMGRSAVVPVSESAAGRTDPRGARRRFR